MCEGAFSFPEVRAGHQKGVVMRRLPAFVVLGLVLGLTGVAPVFASALSVIHVDLDNDTVSGTAEPGVEVTVTANGAVLYELADGAGNWEADFAGVYDILPGSSGEASVVYPGGTEVVAWSVPLPGPQPIEIAVPN